MSHLILRGKLPNKSELAAFIADIQSNRALPERLKKALELLPAEVAPIDVLRTAVSILGDLEPEKTFADQQAASLRMLAAMPSMLLYWYHFSHSGKRIETATSDPSIAAHFLHLVAGKPPSESHIKVMHASLILYAEHEFNASTFTARVCASTLSDIYSCVVGAIGTLKGPLHGGANEAAMDMLEKWKSPAEAEAGILRALAAKEKIMGFGHAIYRTHDPRSPIIQAWAKRLSEEAGDTTLYATAERVADVLWREKNSSPTPTSSTPPPTASSTSPQNFSPPSSSAPASPAGAPTSWNNASTTASSAPAPTTPGRPPRTGSTSAIVRDMDGRVYF